eukprot:s113_g23.t1
MSHSLQVLHQGLWNSFQLRFHVQHVPFWILSFVFLSSLFFRVFASLFLCFCFNPWIAGSLGSNVRGQPRLISISDNCVVLSRLSRLVVLSELFAQF